MAGVIANFFCMPAFSWRLLISPIGSILSAVAFYATAASYYYLVHAATQVVLLKCLYIKYWPSMAAASGNFIAVFLIIVNMIWISVIIGMALVMGHYLTDPIIWYLSGNTDPSFLFETHQMFNMIFGDLVFFVELAIIMIGLIFIAQQKRKTTSALAPPSPQPLGSSLEIEEGNPPLQFNTQKFNKNVLNETTIGLFGCIVAIVVEALVMLVYFMEADQSQTETVCAAIAIGNFLVFTIFPCTYFARHPKHFWVVLDIIRQ